MRNTIIVAVLAVLALGPAAAAERQADDLLYLRGGVGVAEVDSGQNNGSDQVHSLGVGWRFMNWLSVDANYDSLGSWDNAAPGLGGPLDARTSTLSLGVGGTVDFGDSGFFAQARAGMHDWETKYENFETKHRVDGTDPFYAVGVGYDFTDNVGMLLSYERFIVDDELRGDVDRVMLGFELR